MQFKFLKTVLLLIFSNQFSVFAMKFEVPTPKASKWSYFDHKAYTLRPHNLFSEIPNINHIVQTFSLDCPLLAGIASLAYNDSHRLQNMIQQNDDFTRVEIYLYNRNNPTQLDIYAMDAVRDTSTLGAFGERYELSSRGKLWVHLIERAYKYRLELNNERMPSSTSSSGISPADVLRSLLGPAALPFLPVNTYMPPNNINHDKDLELLRLPGIGIVSLNPHINRQNIRNHHAYAILGIEKDSVRIFNPIYEEGLLYTNYPREVLIPLNELLRDFTVYYVPFDSNNQISYDYLDRRNDDFRNMSRFLNEDFCDCDIAAASM